MVKISTSLYTPPTKDRYIYISKRNCNRYIAVAQTPHYRKTKVFDTIEDCTHWIDWFLRTPVVMSESVDDHSVRYGMAKSQLE